MRIGIVIDNDFVSDIRVTKEARILSKYGHEVFVLCYAFRKSNYPNIEYAKTIRIRTFKILVNFFFLSYHSLPFFITLWKKHVKRFIISNDIEILHVHDLYMSFPSYLGVKKSKKKVPIILDLHENFPEAIKGYKWANSFFYKPFTKPYLWKKKESIYLELSDVIIVLSEYYRKELCEKFSIDPTKVFIYPNVIDINLFKSFKVSTSQIDIIKKNPIIFYFGIVAERRGIFDTINVFIELLQSGINATLLIIGPVDKAERKRFNKAINDSIIKDHIIYIKWISLSLLPTYLKLADICVCPLKKNPQHESGVANKIYQYMYGGKPIIASNCKPQEELILNNNCGLIYSDINEYISYLSLLIKNPKLSKQLGKNGFHELITNYCSEKMDENLIRIYKSPKLFTE